MNGDLRREAKNAAALPPPTSAYHEPDDQSGGTLSDGLAATGDFFPPLFREMVYVASSRVISARS